MSGERDLRKRLARLELRVSTLLMLGTAESNQGAKTKVTFDAKGADGQPFRSPFLAQANSAGKTGGGVSRFTKIGQGEPVLVINPGGVIGEHSRVLPVGHVEQHPSPGTAEQDGEVVSVGNASLEVVDGMVRIKVGGASLTLTADTIAAIATNLTHNGVNTGDTHKHTQVQPGGGTSGPPES